MYNFSNFITQTSYLCGFILGLTVVFSCSKDDTAKTRLIRAHDIPYQGVNHALPSLYGHRYCHHCHGANLEGGSSFEPSCYQCHGKNWLDSASEFSYAPSDHTENKQGFMHHPAYQENPTQTCGSCHGADLKGNPISGRPSCYLCHGEIWQ